MKAPVPVLLSVVVGVVACGSPSFTRFNLIPPVACPGDHVTLGWTAINAVNVTLTAPGVDPHFPNRLSGELPFAVGGGDLTINGSANAIGSSATASASVHVITGTTAVTLSGSGECADTGVTVRIHVDPISGLPATLVVDSVRPPDGRSGTLSHGGPPVPFRPGQPAVPGFEGQSLFGDWVLTYELLPGESCRMGGPRPTGNPPPTLAAMAQARCPTTPQGPPPGPVFDTSTCGRLGQDCCPTTTMCNEGLACSSGRCVMGAVTCTGAPVRPGTTQQFVFEVIDALSRCAVGADPVGVLADSLAEAQDCLTARGVVAAPADQVHEHRWHNPATTCLLGSGTIHALDADAAQCARSQCGCDNPEVDGTTCP